MPGEPAARRPRLLEPRPLGLTLLGHLEVSEEPVAGDRPVERGVAIRADGEDVGVVGAAHLHDRAGTPPALDLGGEALGIGERHGEARPQPARPHREPALEIDPQLGVRLRREDVEAELVDRLAAQLGRVELAHDPQRVDRALQEDDGVPGAPGRDDVGRIGRHPPQPGVGRHRGRHRAAATAARTAASTLGTTRHGEENDECCALHADILHGPASFFTQPPPGTFDKAGISQGEAHARYS